MKLVCFAQSKWWYSITVVIVTRNIYNFLDYTGCPSS